MSRPTTGEPGSGLETQSSLGSGAGLLESTAEWHLHSEHADFLHWHSHWSQSRGNRQGASDRVASDARWLH